MLGRLKPPLAISEERYVGARSMIGPLPSDGSGSPVRMRLQEKGLYK